VTTGKNRLAGVVTINERLLNPTPIPLALRCDLVDRLAPMDLKEASGWFVNLVADRIADTGKHIDDLTVREVRQIVEECRVATNKLAKRKRFWWKYT
jgi:hypothetical protein